MPTYKCQKCGSEIVLSMKPGQCEICGASQFRISGQGKAKNPSSKIGQNPPSSTFPSTSTLKSSSLNPSSGRIPKTHLSTGQKSSPSTEDTPSLIVPPVSKHRKTYPQPSLPLYSSPSNPSFPYRRSSPKPSHNTKSHQLLNRILPIALGLTGVSGYWLWQHQFDTSEFNRIVFQESFKSAKNWSLTDGSMIRKGGLFQQQPHPNHYGSSIWMGKNFTDLDFSTEVTKAKGAEDSPYGVIARVSGTSENFYYLLMDGKGEFVLGKHTKDGWFPKVGWKKNKIINQGNTKNHLRIVCKDHLIIGFINHQKVGSFRDRSFTSGKVALFSMRGKGEAASVYFDNALAKEKDHASSSQSTAHLTPQQTVQNYYDRVENSGNEPFGDLVKNVKIYEMKTLHSSKTSAKIKVWLKYQMENGLTICESRVIDLAYRQEAQEWVMQGSGNVAQKPSCRV